MKKYFLYNGLLILLMSFVASSCHSKKEEKEDETVQQLLPDAPAEVTTMPLRTVEFEHELVSNGKVSALTVAEVKFKSSEIIDKIFVRNGDYVNKGQKLATLDTYALRNKMEQAKDALERSKINLQDVLIGQGYRLDSLDDVPENILNLAKVKSGYNTAQTQYNLADYELKGATLTAPISGTVANLSSKALSASSLSDVFCNIIDTRSLEVTFTILENELGFIQKGDKVEITPFALPDVKISGRVSEINPWVDENGMVQVKASVNPHKKLIPGMNVRVSAYRSVGKRWVVPKTAVVLRTGKPVVFSVMDGKAYWNYVETGLENATEYTITSETLKEGDQIIISGNINLAHESPVKVIETNKEQ